MEPFHVVAPKCPGDAGNSDTCKWMPYMHVGCLVYVCEYIAALWITCQASSFVLSRPTSPTLAFFSESFFFLSSRTSVMLERQITLLPVKIMTVIKQLRPERPISQELAFLSRVHRQQMRIQQGIPTLWLSHMLVPCGTELWLMSKR